MSKTVAGGSGGGVGRGGGRGVIATSYAEANSREEAWTLGDAIQLDGWQDSLSQDEKNAIEWYTAQRFERINTILRRDERSLHHLGIWSADDNESIFYAREIDRIDKALERGSGIAQNVIVHRGMNLPSLKGYDNPESGKDPRDFVGKQFTDRAYTSTSMLLSKATPGNVVLSIKVPKGTHAAFVAPISQHPSEVEVLLARGYDFRITKYLGRQGYGRPHYEAEIVGRAWHGDEGRFIAELGK